MSFIDSSVISFPDQVRNNRYSKEYGLDRYGSIINIDPAGDSKSYNHIIANTERRTNASAPSSIMPAPLDSNRAPLVSSRSQVSQQGISQNTSGMTPRSREKVPLRATVKNVMRRFFKKDLKEHKTSPSEPPMSRNRTTIEGKKNDELIASIEALCSRPSLTENQKNSLASLPEDRLVKVAEHLKKLVLVAGDSILGSSADNQDIPIVDVLIECAKQDQIAIDDKMMEIVCKMLEGKFDFVIEEYICSGQLKSYDGKCIRGLSEILSATEHVISAPENNQKYQDSVNFIGLLAGRHRLIIEKEKYNTADYDEGRNKAAVLIDRKLSSVDDSIIKLQRSLKGEKRRSSSRELLGEDLQADKQVPLQPWLEEVGAKEIEENSCLEKILPPGVSGDVPQPKVLLGLKSMNEDLAQSVLVRSLIVDISRKRTKTRDLQRQKSVSEVGNCQSPPEDPPPPAD